MNADSLGGSAAAIRFLFVATEFVGTSISSGGNGPKESEEAQTLQSENSCVKSHDRQRGYVACEVTKEKWQSDYFVVEDVMTPEGAVSKLASFVVKAERAGKQLA